MQIGDLFHLISPNWAVAAKELSGSMKIIGEGYNPIHGTFATSGVETCPRWNQYPGVIR